MRVGDMVPSKQFCNVENRAFPEDEFVSGPNGTTVHVMEWEGAGQREGAGQLRHAKEGHSLDGWHATWDDKSMKLTYEDLILLDAAEAKVARIV